MILKSYTYIFLNILFDFSRKIFNDVLFIYFFL